MPNTQSTVEDRTTQATRDPRRLSTLRRLNLLDTPAEASFDRISKLATRVLGVPIALVSLVDVNRQFFKSCIGLPAKYDTWRETPLGASFCKNVVASGEPLILADARQHLEHRGNDAIAELGAIAYLGCPLIIDDEVVGTFCVVDTRAHEWTDGELSIVQDLAELAMTEIRMRARSEERAAALHTRDRILAIVSHDLRSPVQTILTAAALLELDEPGDEQQATIDCIRRAAAQMNRMIGDLLDVSTIDFDGLSIEPAMLSLTDLVDQLAAFAGPAADEKGVDLSIDAAQLPDIMADEERLLQAIMNILDNAIRLTPAGGSVEISARRADGEVILAIADTGPGIPEASLPSIFEWSWHSEKSEKGGTGLGLSIARGIVKAHGGSIRAENRAEGGAQFTISLPSAGD